MYKIEKSSKNASSRKRKGSPKRVEVVIKTLHQYSSESSIHGIQYVGGHEYSICARTFWTVAVVLALAGTSYQVFNLWTNWFDDPVVTSLRTISLPVERIDFPAVTLCPQGSIAEIMDNVLYHQFEEWLIQKIEADATPVKRKKREEKEADCECIVQSFVNMTNEILQCCLQQFMDDNYPGIYPNNPTEVATMLYADDPNKATEMKAVIQPDEEPECDDTENAEILDTVNQKLNRICPEPFENINDTTCILQGTSEATYNEAFRYCKEHGAASVFVLESFEDFTILDKLFGKL